MKSIIIIGAGISGLSAGCYSQMNGYKSRIFEMHNIPGGLCTSWKRKGYTFDFCIDWMGGVNPKEVDHQIWKELGVLENRKVTYIEELFRLRDADGRYWRFHSDPEKLEEELYKLTFYDADKLKIKQLCKGIASFIGTHAFSFRKPDILYTTWDLIKMALEYRSVFKVLVKYNTTLIRDFYNSIKDPRLREVLSFIYFSPDIPFTMIPPMYTLTNLRKKNMGYPEGGSLGLARAIESKYLSLGGEITCKAKVKRIIVEDNKAVGVVLEDGTEHRADLVISACDRHRTTYDLLEGKYVHKMVEKMFREGSVFPSMMRIFFGVKQDFTKEPDTVMYRINHELNIPGIVHEHTNYFIIRHFSNLEPNFAEPGKSVLVSFYLADYDYWNELHKDKERYRKAKENVAAEIMNALEDIYPGIRERIEVYDVVTPVTVERYTGNYRGSIQGFVEDMTEVKTWINKSGGMHIPGLKNFYQIGQWITLQGLLRVAGGARYAIQTQCRKDHKKFVVSVN